MSSGFIQMSLDIRYARPLVTLAAVLGALGVASAALANHSSLPNLAIASNFLLFHAPVLLFIAARPKISAATVSAVLLSVGLALFAGDLAMRDLAGHALFPLAAPAGGFGLILGWLALAVSAWMRPSAA